MSKSSSRPSAGGRKKRAERVPKNRAAAPSTVLEREWKPAAPAASVRMEQSAGHDIHETRPKPTTLIQASPPRVHIAGDREEWKSSIHRYVSLYNQAETEQHSRVLTDYMTDLVHGHRLTSRLERMRERDLLRGALSAGSETKAELVRVNESANEVSVLLKLHVKRRVEQGGSYYMEERYEYERLWLSASGRHWDVLQVEPIIAERRPRFGVSTLDWHSESDSPSHDEVYLMPSLPYLNYDLMPPFKNRITGIRYRRDLAAAYADRWWNDGNPSYELFDVNCTNYVSQCIFAGNAPMNYTGKRGSGWWYKGRSKGEEWWSYSWAVSNALTQYLSTARKSGLRAEQVQSADQLQLGDVITYDWAGDGRYQHSTIVTAFDATGQPLVNANTVASRHRYWDYRDSYAWTQRTRYRYFHIPDLL
ncbi:amidase domain-containing protein [Paenibacillus paeoniae]|nr:amidase domain-containing protein [Paenibacillus paeoniae]